MSGISGQTAEAEIAVQVMLNLICLLNWLLEVCVSILSYSRLEKLFNKKYFKKTPCICFFDCMMSKNCAPTSYSTLQCAICFFEVHPVT